MKTGIDDIDEKFLKKLFFKNHNPDKNKILSDLNTLFTWKNL